MERAFWLSLTGASATQEIERQVLHTLPTEGHAKRFEDVDRDLKVLEESKLVAFMGLAIKMIVSTVRGYIVAFMEGRSPTLDRMVSCSDFTIAVKARLACFCRCVVTHDEADDENLVGARAVLAMLATAQEKHGSGKDLSYNDINEVLMFGWLLSADERKTAAQIRANAVAKAGVSVPA